MERLAKRIDVYDITVEDAHEFFANGVLVHNCDEIGAWQYPDAIDMLKFGLRLGECPRLCITTTPKATDLIKKLVADPKVIRTGGSTFENRHHLAPTFFDDVIASYDGTRLGRQEIYAEILELVDGVWFANFDKAKHVHPGLGEYHPAFPVTLAIDCGVSQHTGAVWMQFIPISYDRKRVNVFGSFYTCGSFSAKAAQDVYNYGLSLPNQGRVDKVRLDPAATAKTGVGPAAFGEFQDVFGSKLTDKAPRHGVVDALDQIEIMLDRECLVIHPRAECLIEAFMNYRKEERGGMIIHYPKDAQSPYEDSMDALRYGIRDEYPEGHRNGPAFGQMHAGRVY